MVIKLFDFQEKFMIDTFLIKLTQFEKTKSIGTIFIPLGSPEIEIRSKLKSITFFVTLTLLLFKSRV